MQLDLMVIYTRKLKETCEFYQKIGLSFTEEQHGQGPIHYSAKIGSTVFEIFPCSSKQSPTYTRLGFQWKDELEKTANIHSPHLLSFLDSHALEITKMDNGQFYYLLEDPEGRKVELLL